MRRLVTTAIALALLSGGCSSRGTGQSRTQFVLGTTEPLTALDPIGCQDVLCARLVLANTAEGLVRLRPGTTMPEPALASAWTVSDDGRTYTFRLRGGVKFHDGTPLTADAAVKSLDRLKALGGAGGPAFLLYDMSNEPPRSGILSTEAVDANTVRITLAAPDASFPAKLEFPSASIVSPSAYPADRSAPEGVVVGTGPYKLVPGSATDVLELVRNDAYWGPKPATRRVQIHLYPTPDALWTALAAGELDAAWRELPPGRVASAGRGGRLRVIQGDGAAIRFLAFNVKRQPFSTAGVRRAIASGIDRRALVARTGAPASPTYTLLPRGYAARKDAFASAGPSKDAVRSNLDSAGVSSDERVAVDLWFTPTHYGPRESDIAAAVKEQLEATGAFAVSLQSAEWPDFKSSLPRGEYGAYLLGWYPDFLDPDDFLSPFLETSTASVIGSGYSDPDMDAKLQQERTTTDPAKRAELLGQIQDKLAADVPLVPLWQERQVVVARPEVRGLRLDATQAVRLSGVRLAR